MNMLYVAAAGSQKTKKSCLKKDVDGKEDPCMVGRLIDWL